MKRLHVLYDAECRLCRSCTVWLRQQPAFLELRFTPLQAGDLRARFPGIETVNVRDRLVVISDTGAVYQGEHAWIMCLYALREYRGWSQRLAHPLLLPFAERVCTLVSKHRLALSRLFLSAPAAELHAALEAMPDQACRWEGGHCS
jgi:predicted DCC family thiol-disulfide oxidoreductase YuxK